MESKIKSNGHGFFIILPDLPSRNCPNLPSLCYRKSQGLLARVCELNELERLIYDSVMLFNSKEGDGVDENSCSCLRNCIDSITVGENFVENVDRFVEAMDRVSNGEFLRGEESGLSSEWFELNWLKAKGYYSIEAFVANKLEVALRLSWLNCNSGKKKGGKLKEKTSMVGVAANVYWRKKGCMDWWGNLDKATKEKVFWTVLGKSTKSLVLELVFLSKLVLLFNMMFRICIHIGVKLFYSSFCEMRWQSEIMEIFLILHIIY